MFLSHFERSMVFFPSKYPEGNWQPQGLKFEDAWFFAADQTKLHGWYVEHPQPQAVILYFHGNAGNLSHRADIIATLSRQLSSTIMIFDYRGYGRSAGQVDGGNIFLDGEAARAWLAKRAGVDQKDIVLLGRSLGGAVAIGLAAKLPARALIVESSFSSLPDVAAVHFPWLPARWLMEYPMDSVELVGKYHGPFFQSHGDADEVVPYSTGEKLFAAANEPKTFVTLPKGRHNDPLPPFYLRRLQQFISAL